MGTKHQPQTNYANHPVRPDYSSVTNPSSFNRNNQYFNMAQATEEELNQQQPGASEQPQQDDKDKELEKMKKMLAEKDAEIEKMKKKLEDKDNQNDDNTTSGGTADG